MFSAIQQFVSRSGPPAVAAGDDGDPTVVEMVATAVPQGMRCALTQEVMANPVLAEDGYSYERAAWERYAAQHSAALTSPVTHAPLSPTVLNNRHLKTAIGEYRMWIEAAELGPFDLAAWAEDAITHEPMTEPVQLPDAMVCDVQSAVNAIFLNAERPGRSLLDPTTVFAATDTMRRNLHVLALSEEAQGLMVGNLRRDYEVPALGSLLTRPLPTPAAPVPARLHAPILAGYVHGAGVGLVGGTCTLVGVAAFTAPLWLGIWMVTAGLPGYQPPNSLEKSTGVIMVALSPCWMLLISYLLSRPVR